MEVFRQLGLHIKQRWARLGYDQDAFTDLATSALEAQPPFAVTLEDVYSWVQTSHEWVSHIETPFGNPITVYRDQRFYIEVLTWVDGTTSIHEHAFSGAFAVLQGSSIHARYAFTPTRRISERLVLGRTEVTSVELLRQGQIRPIHAGPRSAHALFHLTRPSLSLVIRTGAKSTTSIQYSYERSGLAFDPFYEDHEATRIVRTLHIMHEIGHPEFAERARRVLCTRDAHTQYQLLREMSTWMKLEPFLEIVDELAAADSAAGETSVDRELLATMRRNAHVYRRERNIVARRTLIQHPEHRFFLALLLNLRSRDELLALVRQAHPDHDPIDVVCRWVTDLSAEKAPEPSTEPNVLGIEFDEATTQIFRLLMQGATEGAILDTLGADYDMDDESRSGVRDLCAAFRESLLFGPLFSDEVDAPLARA